MIQKLARLERSLQSLQLAASPAQAWSVHRQAACTRLRARVLKSRSELGVLNALDLQAGLQAPAPYSADWTPTNKKSREKKQAVAEPPPAARAALY